MIFMCVVPEAEKTILGFMDEKDGCPPAFRIRIQLTCLIASNEGRVVLIPEQHTQLA